MGSDIRRTCRRTPPLEIHLPTVHRPQLRSQNLCLATSTTATATVPLVVATNMSMLARMTVAPQSSSITDQRAGAPASKCSTLVHYMLCYDLNSRIGSEGLAHKMYMSADSTGQRNGCASPRYTFLMHLVERDSSSYVEP